MIGVTQALETIKVIVGPEKDDTYKPSMTIFSAFDSPQWRTFRLRPRKSDCPACGLEPSITTKTIELGDYANICRRVVPTEIVERVSPQV
jgi:adenylyltransferase/sulfurtransferase